jgi:hypothetical protein
LRYVLRKRVIAYSPELEIDEIAFENYRSARVVLTQALAIEEKYEIVVCNYLELEQEALNISATDMVRRDFDYSHAFEDRLSLNRRVVNLLTAARLYLDRLGRHVEGCTGAASSLAAIDAARAAEYDRRFEYRFLEALRNYTQHNGTPVHWTSHGSRWLEIDGNRQMHCYLQFGSDKATLAQDGYFKATVLREMPERVDLMMAARAYVEGLSAIHDKARELSSTAVEAARELMSSTQQRYLAAGAENTIGLSACALDATDIETSFTALLLDWDDVRLDLNRRNGKLVNLHKRFVSSQSTFTAEDAAKAA